MLITNSTEQRIVNAMEKGAKLVYHYYYMGYDGWSICTKISLELNGKELTLNDPVIHGEEDPGEANCDVADRIIKRDDIREAYTYVGEYDKKWRRRYEHRSTPVPRWVTEQWGCDDDGNLIPPEPEYEPMVSNCDHDVHGDTCVKCGYRWGDSRAS